MTDKLNPNEESVPKSCDSQLTRKEFLTKLVKRAGIAGALVAAPGIIDKFLIPPAYAVTSTIHLNDTSVSADTNHFHDVHSTTNSFHDNDSTNVHADSPTTNVHSDSTHTGVHADVDDDFG